MAEIIRMPRMSDTMTEGNIVEWHKKVGDSIEPGDVLADVETDKATMELESYFEGILLHIGVEKGVVAIDAILAVIGEKGEDWEAAITASETTSSQSTEPKTEENQSLKSDVPDVAITQALPENKASNTDSRIKASPLAKKIAEEKGIDLNSISGSGTEGRIVKKDLENISSSTGEKSQNTSHSVVEKLVSDLVIPVTQMRKTIARRLGESKFTAPHFYLTITIDMDNAIKTRKEINAMIAPQKFSFNDLVVKAAATALKIHPMINASWNGDEIIQHANVNIGVAVAVDDGLLVPVIKNADSKSLTEINALVKDYAGRARNKKLQLDEMQGNTFTISNLGMFGIEEFTAIINSPDSCILAVGGISQLPVVKDGKITIGNQMKVTLSCDHRVVDGVTGAKFLNTFRDMMSNPVRMIV